MGTIKNVKMITSKREKNIVSLFLPFLFSLMLILCAFTCHAGANTVVEIGQVNTPHGAVILIIDGLSSCYVYPEFTPYAIDGTILEKAETPKMQEIFDNSCRILEVTVPQTFTEGGHSVIATGYSKADAELTGSSRTTLFDVGHDYEYMTFAIMEKGDSYGFCSKQNVIMHDTANSVNEPEMVISTNMLSESTKNIAFDVVEVMNVHSSELQEKLDQHPEGSLERYNEYDTWAIDSAISVINYMAEAHPEQHYILTVNVGGVDCAGHYKKNSGYIESIEGIDNASYELYETCLDNNLAFVLTGDHGMAFPADDSKGGHQSDKYSVMTESQKVPLIIAAEDIENGIVKGEYGQEDIAPTLIEVLNIPGKLRLADGKAITLKDYANLEVRIPEKGDIVLSKNDELLFEDMISENIAFLGLEPGIEYTITFIPESTPGEIVQEALKLDSDTTVQLSTSSQNSKNKSSDLNSRHVTGGVLIAIINLTGLFLIRKVLKE